jgi:hypothetical protein
MVTGMSTHRDRSFSSEVSPAVVRVEVLRRRGLELEAELREVNAELEMAMAAVSRVGVPVGGAVRRPVVQTAQQPAVLR